MTQLMCERINSIRDEIAHCEQRFGRAPGSVSLLAVSKTHPAEQLIKAVQCGQFRFGENYAQELESKARQAGLAQVEWHFIGPLQSNKSRIVAEHAHWIHSVDRLKIAQRLSEQRPAGLPPLQVCLEVNVDEEDSKSGLAPDDLALIAEEIAMLPNLTLRGLMCIPLATTDTDQQRRSFARLRLAMESLQTQGHDKLDTLSMGMSADFPMAIAEGATIVRVGTAIFGARS